MAKSQASNFDLPSYWWPRSRTRIHVSWKKSSAQVAEQAVLVLLDQAVEQIGVALLQAARNGFRLIAHQRGEEQDWSRRGRGPEETGPVWRQT